MCKHKQTLGRCKCGYWEIHEDSIVKECKEKKETGKCSQEPEYKNKPSIVDIQCKKCIKEVSQIKKREEKTKQVKKTPDRKSRLKQERGTSSNKKDADDASVLYDEKDLNLYGNKKLFADPFLVASEATKPRTKQEKGAVNRDIDLDDTLSLPDQGCNDMYELLFGNEAYSVPRTASCSGKTFIKLDEDLDKMSLDEKPKRTRGKIPGSGLRAHDFPLEYNQEEAENVLEVIAFRIKDLKRMEGYLATVVENNKKRQRETAKQIVKDKANFRLLVDAAQVSPELKGGVELARESLQQHINDQTSEVRKNESTEQEWETKINSAKQEIERMRKYVEEGEPLGMFSFHYLSIYLLTTNIISIIVNLS